MKKPKTVHDAVGRDIAQHFHNKLQLLLSDTIDTGRRAGIDNSHAILIIMTGMMVETVKGSMMIRMNRDQFAGFCAETYREVERIAGEDE